MNVTIVNDQIVEKNETIEISGYVTDRRIRITGGTKVITITDNDSMYKWALSLLKEIPWKLLFLSCCSASEEPISECTRKCWPDYCLCSPRTEKISCFSL